MKSRAHMLLEKEYVKLQKEPLWGIVAEPLNEGDIFLWEANICGLKDTIWEGGVFKVYLQFNAKYSFVPPEVIFRTIPFHPNVDMSTGKPCVDFLDNADDWDQNYNIGYILLALQTMLVNPVIDEAVNEHAASVCVDNPKIYHQMVMDCVLESQRLHAHLPSRHVIHEQVHSDNTANKSVERRAPRNHTNKITFGYYLSLWKGIATSSYSSAPSMLNNILKNDTQLQHTHFELSRDELQQEIRLQFQEHNRLMYGSVAAKERDTEYSFSESKNRRPSKVKLLRHIPLSSTSSSPGQTTTPVNECQDFDKEAQDLVNWSKNLSPEQTNF